MRRTVATTVIMMQIVYSSESSPSHSSTAENTPGETDYIQPIDLSHLSNDHHHASDFNDHAFNREINFQTHEYSPRVLAPISDDTFEQTDDDDIDEFDRWSYDMIQLFLSSDLESSEYSIFNVGCKDMAEVLTKTVLSPTKSDFYADVTAEFAVLMMIICPSYKPFIDTNFKFDAEKLQDALLPVSMQLGKQVYAADIGQEKKQLLLDLTSKTYPDIHWNANIIRQFAENYYECTSAETDLEMFVQNQGYIFNEVAALLMIFCPQTQGIVFASKQYDSHQFELYQGMQMANTFIRQEKESDVDALRLWFNADQNFASKFMTGTYGQLWKASLRNSSY